MRDIPRALKLAREVRGFPNLRHLPPIVLPNRASSFLHILMATA